MSDKNFLEAEKSYNNGIFKMQMQNLESALADFQDVLKIIPEHADSYNCLGLIYESQGKIQESINSFKTAISYKPHNSQFYNNLGLAYYNLNQFEQAISCYNQALKLEPDNINYFNNLATTYVEFNDYQKAISYYLQALEIRPFDQVLRNNLALCYLIICEFEKGWEEFQWVLYKKKQQFSNIPNKMAWKGGNFKDKILYIYAEQGFGDTIQFIRYLPLVKARGGKIIFSNQKGLTKLLKDFQAYDQMLDDFIIPPDYINKKSEIPYFDYYASLLSLMGIFKTDFNNIPAEVPYIKVDQQLNDKWKIKLNEDKNFKIGLVWNCKSSSVTKLKRCCPLKEFFTLFDIPGLSFFSLQKVDTSDQLRNLPPEINIVNLSNELKDFSDTAAIINNLDLVISIDTSVAHLAGALGKPVWTILHYSPDWRWFLEREDSPWYPTMKLFRQDSYGDWGSVFKKLKSDLITYISP